MPDLSSRRSFLRHTAALLAAAAAPPLVAPAHANDLVVGQAAPALALRTLDGHVIDTRELHGQVVIATFWATWCQPCRAELPLLSSYAERHAGDGLQVLGFSLDAPDDLAAVKKAAQALSFPVGLLGSPWVRGYGRIWRIPVNFVIDRNGRLAYDGWKDEAPGWTEASLRQVVTPLLRREG